VKLQNEIERKFKEIGFNSIESYLFPKIININVLSGKCYCKCIHCPVGIVNFDDRKERFRYQELELNLYKKLVDEILTFSNQSVLRIHSVGEPIMWKKIIRAIKYSKKKAIRTWLFTSAVTDDKNLLQELCKNIDIIEISINSISRDNYLKSKGIDAFDLVSKNIEYMRKYIKKEKLTTRIIASRVESMNKEADANFITYWQEKNLLDDVFIRSYHTYNDEIEELESNKKIKKATPCLVHWARFNIDVTGDVVVCFNELFKEKINKNLIYGNVYQKSIKEIWQSEKLYAIRKAELSGDYSTLYCKDDLPCINCYSCQPLYSTNKTSESQIEKLKGKK
jgi:MoaA/NifB/PqqE/SkfB family radical SAM enzyme